MIWPILTTRETSKIKKLGRMVWEKSVEKEQKSLYAVQAKREEENKIVQFGGTGESKSNNNTGNVSFSPLDSFPSAKIKKITINKGCCEVSLPLLCGILSFFLPWLLSSRSISLVIQQCSFSSAVRLPFPRRTLRWHPLEQFKYNIKHMAMFLERKWNEKSN